MMVLSVQNALYQNMTIDSLTQTQDQNSISFKLKQTVDSKDFDQYHNKPFSFDMALIFVVWVEGERDKETETECVCARVCAVSTSISACLSQENTFLVLYEKGNKAT